MQLGNILFKINDDHFISDSKASFKSLLENLSEFSEHTTIQGLVYVFSKNLSFFGKTFWLFSVCFTLSTGMFWTAEMYTNWHDQQVFTYPTHPKLT